MVESECQVIDIGPEEIPTYLAGINAVRGESIVRCEGIDICKLVDGKVTHVACVHSAHGVSPRYREIYSRIDGLLRRLDADAERKENNCPTCGTKYWLPIDSDVAKSQVSMALCIGSWKGIGFNSGGGLNIGDAGAMVKSILNAARQKDASSGPVGMAAPDRTNFFSGQNQTGKGAGK